MKTLSIKNLSVSVGEKSIVEHVDLNVGAGEMHVIMGPNGSGKSSLLYGLMGHPVYKVQSPKSKVQSKKAKKTQILLNEIDITESSPEERAKAGLFLAFQNPLTVPGVSISNFLQTAYKELYGKNAKTVVEIHRLMQATCKELGLDDAFLRRSINDGFSGGEKKKAEMLQLLVLKPKYALFDEIDTGLDVDALKIVAKGISILQKTGVGILLVTHYQRILKYVRVDQVHIMKKGSIIKSGGAELIKIVETDGYAGF